MPGMSPVVEEFYNKFHSRRDGRFTSGGAASGRAGFREGSHSSPYGHGPTKVTGIGGKSVATPHNFPRGDKRVGPVHSVATNKALSRAGHAVLGKPQPLRNATTGRINPSAVRAAFKQNNAQSGGAKSSGSKRTEHIGSTPVTSKTFKGRKIQHVVTGGKPVKPMGLGHRWTAATHTQTKAKQ